MAELFHRTRSSYTGPWLFDREALIALDGIIDDQWQRLQGGKKAAMKNAARRAIREVRSQSGFKDIPADGQKELTDAAKRRARDSFRFRNDCRRIVLTLDSGLKSEVPSFKVAMEDAHFRDCRVAQAEVELECDGVRASVDFLAFSSEDVDINVFPESADAAQETFVGFDRWASGNQPDWKRRWWRPLGLALFILASFAFLICWLVSSAGVTRDDGTRAAAKELLAKGIGPGDERIAIELLLAIATGARSEPRAVSVHIGVWVVTSVLMAIGIMMAVTPVSSAFEIGKGAPSVRRQKRWMRFNAYTLPLFVLSGFVIPIVRPGLFDWVKSLFG